jgi:hypothetical protein
LGGSHSQQSDSNGLMSGLISVTVELQRKLHNNTLKVTVVSIKANPKQK